MARDERAINVRCTGCGRLIAWVYSYWDDGPRWRLKVLGRGQSSEVVFARAAEVWLLPNADCPNCGPCSIRPEAIDGKLDAYRVELSTQTAGADPESHVYDPDRRLYLKRRPQGSP